MENNFWIIFFNNIKGKIYEINIDENSIKFCYVVIFFGKKKVDWEYG